MPYPASKAGLLGCRAELATSLLLMRGDSADDVTDVQDCLRSSEIRIDLVLILRACRSHYRENGIVKFCTAESALLFIRKYKFHTKHLGLT